MKLGQKVPIFFNVVWFVGGSRGARFSSAPTLPPWRCLCEITLIFLQCLGPRGKIDFLRLERGLKCCHHSCNQRAIYFVYVAVCQKTAICSIPFSKEKEMDSLISFNQVMYAPA